MSSPSSTGSSKRKRTTASERLKSTNDLLQPSSRDASGEELAESGTPAHNTRRSKHAAANSFDGTTASGLPNKRARTRSNATEMKANGNVDGEIAQQDPGEPSSATQDSEDIEEEEKEKARKRERSGTQKSGNGGNDSNVNKIVGESQPLQAPPKAGMRDPLGGYKTNPPPQGRPVRIYADGVFDLFHLGHMRQLQQAKTAFPSTYLLVGVTGDAETHKRKGLTVLSGAERAETVRHCKWVDEVIPNCPWIVTPEFLAEHQIDYVAHDDEPYGAAEGDDIYGAIKKEGKFLVTERTEGVSTTGIITKIVRDYEKYIARQLKRGTSRQELNVSWLKKNELDIKRHVTELRESIKSNWTQAGGEIGRDLRAFWQGQQSRPNSPAPFGRQTSGEGGLRSPSGIEHLKHLDVPGGGSRSDSPGRLSRSEDFATGYTLGLIGGVKSWMTRSRGSLRDSQAPSLEGSEDDEARSPVSNDEEAQNSPVEMRMPQARGRKGRGAKFIEDELKRDPFDVVH